MCYPLRQDAFFAASWRQHIKSPDPRLVIPLRLFPTFGIHHVYMPRVRHSEIPGFICVVLTPLEVHYQPLTLDKCS
jgi:PhoPQ-activated pathogenicity-related protein